ncbi:MAG TPA: sigma-70 family RNA polymerase sigma factor [Crocinitomix sp.]|nr:sigma-70 family RNA polymerase sigma factor [Crocinitomix sp.]
MAQLSDADLIDEIKNGNQKLAIGELYKRYAHLMYGVGLKYLKNKNEAEDIVMHIFENIAVKLSKSNIKNLKNWLYTVTKNECLMKLRRYKTITVEVENALLFKPDSSQEELSIYLQNEQKYKALEQAILKLKEVQRVCIELFYLKSKCYDEVAIETGYDLKKVKSYIQNGKRNLKLILQNEQVFRA